MAPKGALRVLERLNAAGFEAYFVGGCVRDILRGAAPHDWDICTAARPEEAAQCFDSARVQVYWAQAWHNHSSGGRHAL